MLQFFSRDSQDRLAVALTRSGVSTNLGRIGSPKRPLESYDSQGPQSDALNKEQFHIVQVPTFRFRAHYVLAK